LASVLAIIQAFSGDYRRKREFLAFLSDNLHAYVDELL